MSTSRDSPVSSPPTSNRGERGFRGQARKVKVVFTQSAASPSNSPRRGKREQSRHAKANVINRIQEDSQQEEHCYGLNDREVNCHSWSPTPPAPPAPNGSYLPLTVSYPMCGSRLARERTLQLNPKAPEYQPSSLDVGHWASGQLSSGQLPAVWASTTWVDGAQFLGIGPWPSPGFGPTIPLFGPSPGGPANPGWLPIYNSGAWGTSHC